MNSNREHHRTETESPSNRPMSVSDIADSYAEYADCINTGPFGTGTTFEGLPSRGGNR